MTTLRIVPPDGTDWTVDAKVVPEGVALVVGFELNGKPATLQLIMDRPEARKLSDGLLTAAGDGTMRTFAHPQPEEA